MTEIPLARPKRLCDVCGGYDDHPRHVIAWPLGAAPQPDQKLVAKLAAQVDFTTTEGAAVLQDFFDTTLQLRHMDCCREAGCPDGTCSIVTSGAEDLRGPDLQYHLETREGETNFVDGRPESEVVAELLAQNPEA